MTQLICCSEAEAETDRQITLPRLQALFAAVRDFDARFTARKRERKLLEFSDFEHLALRLLRTPMVRLPPCARTSGRTTPP